jgi:NADPH-dependent 2,4-dienoyl-CoA reductase/sulfur reductase-like enzyme
VIEGDAEGHLLAERRDATLEIRGDAIVLATGARELFLPFPGWTLPGVLGVGAAQALVKSGARFGGSRVVIAGSGPLLLPAAAALAGAGARLSVVAEQSAGGAVRRFAVGLWRRPMKVVEALRYRLGFWASPYRCGVWVEAASGDERVREVRLTDGSRSWSERCDVLCSSYGLVPNVELARRIGCELGGNGVWVDDDQRTTVEGVFCAGEASGIGGADLALVEGEIAGAHAIGTAESLADLKARRASRARFAAALARGFQPRPALGERIRPDTIVCRCEDVSWRELVPAWSFRQAKLYTRVGMGACQGRVCGPILSWLCGWSPDSVRPPLQPCRVGLLSGSATARCGEPAS